MSTSPWPEPPSSCCVCGEPLSPRPFRFVDYPTKAAHEACITDWSTFAWQFIRDLERARELYTTLSNVRVLVHELGRVLRDSKTHWQRGPNDWAARVRDLQARVSEQLKKLG